MPAFKIDFNIGGVLHYKFSLSSGVFVSARVLVRAFNFFWFKLAAPSALEQAPFLYVFATV